MSLCARGCDTPAPKVTQSVGVRHCRGNESSCLTDIAGLGLLVPQRTNQMKTERGSFPPLLLIRQTLSASLIDPSRALSCCAANVARRFLSLSSSQNFIKIERTWCEKREVMRSLFVAPDGIARICTAEKVNGVAGRAGMGNLSKSHGAPPRPAQLSLHSHCLCK
jgi:hypothetical protein